MPAHASEEIAEVNHTPAPEELRGRDLLVHERQRQQVVAGEELTAAQYDQHQSHGEECRAHQLGDARLKDRLGRRRRQQEYVGSEPDIDAGRHAEQKSS